MQCKVARRKNKMITKEFLRKEGYANHPCVPIEEINFHLDMTGVCITNFNPKVGDWYEEIHFGGSGFNESISYIPLKEEVGEAIIIERLLGNFERQSVQVMEVGEDIVVFRYPQYDFPSVPVAHRERNGYRMSQAEWNHRHRQSF